MVKIEKILVPTDFSDNAATAYNVAHKMASRFNAKVDFIHVVQTMDYYHESIAKLNVPLKTDEDLYPQLKQQAAHRIKKLMKDYLKSENKGESIVQIAPRPSKAIAVHAERGNYDLILMATLGAHDSNFLIGSVAEKVIRYSKVPVLTTGKSNLDEVKNIMVPTYGSEMSLKALPIAISMALTFDAGITLFHAQELYASLTEEVMKDPSKSDQENIRDAIYSKLEMYFTQLGDKVELRRGEDFESQFVYYNGASNTAINVSTVIVRGISAHRAIVEYASQKADMVVMATHGRSGLAHVFMGSTAENVARYVTLPVITVKPDFDEVSDLPESI